MALMDTARQLADGAERARLAGDTVASLALAIKAAELLQLAKLLGDVPPAPTTGDDK